MINGLFEPGCGGQPFQISGFKAMINVESIEHGCVLEAARVQGSNQRLIKSTDSAGSPFIWRKPLGGHVVKKK